MKRIAKIFLLTIGIGMVALLASKNPNFMPDQGASSVAASEQKAGLETETVILHVDGMTCRRCVPAIREALLEIPGVKKARVSYKEERAEVECEKGKVTDGQLIKSIEDQSGFFLTFTAEVIDRK